MLLALLLPQLSAAQPPVEETPQQRDQRMQWWREARFGMFIHWGLYAIPAGEWKGQQSDRVGEWIMEWFQIPPSEYEQLVPQFNPTKFDAKQWVQIAKDAGMKYIVITTKHHDGFCLFDSKLTDYDIMATPFKRDIMKELSDAARAEGIQICWYHSIMDWHHPQARGDAFPQYAETLKGQVRELLTNYGPIGVMWFDGEWIDEWTEPQGRELYDLCRSIQPDVIVNNRVGKGREGMKGFAKPGEWVGDFHTPEQEIPGEQAIGQDWESCITMNGTWGYKKHDHNWKSSQTLIRMLIDTAAKGGNLLLNVGPTAQGEIPQPSVDRLAEIGTWLKINGESIYGTQASPIGTPEFGRFTTRPGKLYVHVFDWPSDGRLLVPIANEVKRASLLADPNAVPKLERTNAGLNIHVPDATSDAAATVIVLEIEGEPQRPDH